MLESERIKKAIKEAGFTQKQMAEKMGITQPTFNTFVRGKNRPSIKTLKKIAQITNKNLEYFLPSDSENQYKEENSYLLKEIENIKKQIETLNAKLEDLNKKIQ